MEIERIKKDADIKNAIVRTIAFFDLFDYPVTIFQIWKFIDVKCELEEIMQLLDFEPLPNPPLAKGRELSGIIECKNGFYFLAGREEIIKERLARYNYTDKKFKRAIWLAKIFKFIPWIKMIAVSNIIGAHNLKDDSDIDLFIITKTKRVWLTRFFCVLVTKILGLRPKPARMRNKICLSFFINEEAMNLAKLMMPDDIYFIHWLAGLVPIYDSNNTYTKFIDANTWLKSYLPNWQSGEVNYKREAGQAKGKFYYEVVDMLVGGLEKSFKNWQLKIMPDELRGIINIDTRVVANDKVIKLHVNDRREEYKNKLKVKNEKLKVVL